MKHLFEKVHGERLMNGEGMKVFDSPVFGT